MSNLNDSDSPNYVKSILASKANIIFSIIMLILMAWVNLVGFGFLFLIGEIIFVMLAQVPSIQRYFDLQAKVEGQEDLKEKSEEIGKQLDGLEANLYREICRLCEEIEDAWSQLNSGNNYLLSSLIQKLGSFRYEYARMLQAYSIISHQNNTQTMIDIKNDMESNLEELKNETSPEIINVLKQNLKIFAQRVARLDKEDELKRLLKTRLSLVKNSLKLLKEEVCRNTAPEELSTPINNLLSSLNINNELKSTYDDILKNYPTSQEEYLKRKTSKALGTVDGEFAVDSDIEKALKTVTNKVNNQNQQQNARNNIRQIKQK